MVLEAIIICLDNSDWTRNGDYFPSRWETQIDAANFIIENKCEKNPENALGIISMASKVEVHSSLTNEESRLLHCISDISINGECDILTALNISMLTLKHRMNKNQKQRIILFVGSPIKNTPQEMSLIGKKLKKYNVSMDIISFGHVEENKEKLTQLLNSVNNSNSSSLTEVPVGSYIMDALLTSSIVNEGMDQMGGGMQIDNPSGMNANVNQQGVGLSQFERDLNLAMQMSLQEANKSKPTAPATNTPAVNEEINEDEELERAKLLSLQENEKVLKKEKEQKEKEMTSKALADEDFIKDILEEVTNEKPKDSDVKEVMKDLKDEKEDKGKKEEENKKEDDKMDVDKEDKK